MPVTPNPRQSVFIGKQQNAKRSADARKWEDEKLAREIIESERRAAAIEEQRRSVDAKSFLADLPKEEH